MTEAVKIDLSECPVMNRKTGFRTNSVLCIRSSLSVEHTSEILKYSPSPSHCQLTTLLGLQKSAKSKMCLFNSN